MAKLALESMFSHSCAFPSLYRCLLCEMVLILKLFDHHLSSPSMVLEAKIHGHKYLPLRYPQLIGAVNTLTDE